MGKTVDMCVFSSNGKLLHFYRVISDDVVEAAYEVSREEYDIVNRLLRERSSGCALTKILGIPTSMCLTYYGVPDDVISEITRYGRKIPKPGEEKQ